MHFRIAIKSWITCFSPFIGFLLEHTQEAAFALFTDYISSVFLTCADVKE